MSAEPTRFYPAFLDLTGRPVVIIGGDDDAKLKADALIKAGADVTVIAPLPGRGIRQLQAGALIILETRPYVRGDLSGAFLVFCTEEDPEVRRAVFAEADARGLLVNVVGDRKLCNFIVPSVVRRGPLQIAISTGGTSPAAAKAVRRVVKEQFDRVWGSWVTLLGEIHPLVVERVAETEDMIELLDRIAAADLVSRLRAGEELTAEKVFEEFARPETLKPEQDVGADTAEAEHDAGADAADQVEALEVPEPEASESEDA